MEEINKAGRKLKKAFLEDWKKIVFFMALWYIGFLIYYLITR
jgi:hypothetical protein